MDNLKFYAVNFSDKLNVFDKLQSEKLANKMNGKYGVDAIDYYPAYTILPDIKLEFVSKKSFFFIPSQMKFMNQLE